MKGKICFWRWFKKETISRLSEGNCRQKGKQKDLYTREKINVILEINKFKDVKWKQTYATKFEIKKITFRTT